MLASTVVTPGPPEVLRIGQVLRPDPGPDDVLVRVRAASLDRVDTYIRAGTHGMAPAGPVVTGRDLAGTVEAVGARVTGFAPGDDVLALGTGAHAEYALAPAGWTFPKPTGWSFEQAASLPTAGRTAFDAVVNLAAVGPGDRVLVVAAGGAVGSFALQYARHLGATVFATAGSADKRTTALRHGATAAFDHYAGSLVEDVRSATDGAGVDVIVESVGGTLWSDLLSVLAPWGRIVTCGVTASARSEVHLGRLMVQGWTIRGVGRPDRPTVAAHVRGALDLSLAAGEPPIVSDVFPLRDAVAAHRHLESSAFFGRVVLRP
jgi:NADPH:quinone reductase